MGDGQEKIEVNNDVCNNAEKCEKMKMCEKILEYYKTAIDGRNTHLEHYNHWMNMYAIINGALFVGFYSIFTQRNVSCYFYIKLAILVLGCVAGWFWHFSTKGFYEWMLSWLNVISFYENKLSECTESDSVYIYRAFIISKGNKMLNEKTIQPFSTQKLTQKFTFVVAIVWSAITICVIGQKILTFNSCENTCSEKMFILIACIGILVLPILLTSCGVSCCRESNLKTTHKEFKKEKFDEFTPID